MKLYYGNGNCTIEDGAENIGIVITYKGAIEINDLTPDGYAIAAGNNKIIIFFYKETGIVLGDLFSYIGTLNILKVEISGVDGIIRATIHKVMDYSELLNAKAEDMTTISEDLSAGYTSHRKIAKTVLKQKIIPNLHTSDGALYYLPDDTVYSGDYHIHLTDNTVMTGGEHTDDSILLKIKVMRKRKNIRKRAIGQSTAVSSKRISPEAVGIPNKGDN